MEQLYFYAVFILPEQPKIAYYTAQIIYELQLMEYCINYKFSLLKFIFYDIKFY